MLGARLAAAILLLSAHGVLAAVDAPPVIATSAAATPAVVSGKTSSLSVLATDDGGTAALVYRWSGSGPGTVAFSVNGNATAKSTTATFGAAGEYACTVTVTDAAGQDATSTVAVRVDATLTTLAISPTSAVVNPGQTRAFAVVAKNQFGAAMAASPAWTASGGGAVDQAGLFTAGGVPGTAGVTVTVGSRSATAAVRVDASPVIELAATGEVLGKTLSLAATGSDPDDAATALKYTWSASGPRTVGFSPNGTTAAANATATFAAAGTYVITATVKDPSGQAASTVRTVVVQAVPTAVTLTPNVATTVVNPGATRVFTAAVKDQFAATIASPALSWSVVPASAGAVAASGALTAVLTGGQPAAATITATAGQASGSAPVRIDAAPAVSLAAVAPVTTTTAALAAAGSDPDDATLAYTWSASGPKAVAFAPNGTATAANATATFTAAGSYQLTVTAKDPSGRTATASQVVEVRSVPTTVTVAPNTVTTVVNPGAAKSFTATVKDQFKATVPAPELSWTVDPASAGTIASSGALTAVLTGGVPAAAQVTARAGSAAGSVPVRVNAAPTIAIPVATTASVPFSGTTATFSVQGADDVNPLLLTYTWSASGPKGVTFVPRSGVNNTQSTAAFGKVGSYVITATLKDQQGLATTSTLGFEVLPVTSSATLNPAAAVLKVGTSKAFAVQLRDQFATVIAGATIPAGVQWSVSGVGSISAAGTFSAGTVPGTSTITAVVPGAQPLIATATIQVITTQAIATPVITPATGTFTAPFTAMASDAQAGAVLHYRTDGLPATAGDPVFPVAGLPITRGTALSVIATASGWQPSATASATYALQALPVTANLAGGTYTGGQSVTLACATPGAVISATTDGTTWRTVGGPLALDGSTTLTAVGSLDGWIASVPQSWVYTLQVPTPTLTPEPAAEPVVTPLTVTAQAADPQATLRYTLDGTAPTAASPQLPATGVVLVRDTVVAVVAERAGWQPSAPAMASYRVRLPPVITAGPTASPQPVTGTATTLAVTASDPAGRALSYQWMLGAGAPAEVVFADAAAAGTTATFTAPGSYDLGVTVTNAVGAATGATVTVTVVATPAAVAIAPTGATVVVGGEQVFAATVTDQFGQPSAEAVTWSASGAGTIAQDGRFVAGASPGAASVAAVVTSRPTVAASAVVAVAAPPNAPPTVAIAAVATTNPVGTGPVSLYVMGADDGGETHLVYTWSATGPAPVTWSANGSNAAKNTVATITQAGTYAVHATITDEQGATVVSDLVLEVGAGGLVIRVQDTSAVFDGQPHPVTVVTEPPGVPCAVTYAGGGAVPVHAGSYAVVATSTDPAFPGTVAATLVIQPAEASVALSQMTITADGRPHAAVVRTTPADLAVEVVYEGVDGLPIAPGTYTVQATVTDPDHRGAAVGLFVINPDDAVDASLVFTTLPRPASDPVYALSTTLTAVAHSGLGGDARIVYSWSLVKGPGEVLFSLNNSTGAGTTEVTFRRAGAYVFSCTANLDGVSVAREVSMRNEALYFTRQPHLVVKDDGQMTARVAAQAVTGATGGGPLSYTWEVRGPAAVAITPNGTPSAAEATLTFVQSGSYEVTCTATRDGFSALSDKLVVVNSAIAFTTAPFCDTPVATGPTAMFHAMARATGYPDDEVIYTWYAAGPGTVVFAGNASHAAHDTLATFDQVGEYDITCVATCHGLLVACEPFTVHQSPVEFSVQPFASETPVRHDRVTLGALATAPELAGEVAYTWRCTSGPAAVHFTVNGTTAAGETQAQFSKNGAYTIVCDAHIGQWSIGSSELKLEVKALDFITDPVLADNPYGIIFQPQARFTASARSGIAGDEPIRYSWSLIEGPAPITWSGNGLPQAANILATFSQPGSYIVSCMISCGTFTATREVTVQNKVLDLAWLPRGTDTVALGDRFYLGVAATSPDPSEITYAWSGVCTASHATVEESASGPAQVLFDSTTTAGGFTTYTQPGIYEVTCTATWHGFTRTLTAKMTVVRPLWFSQTPTILEPAGWLQMDVWAAAGGFWIGTGAYPDRTLRYAWSGSGPQPVTFEHADNWMTTVHFSEVGHYTLTCTLTWGPYTVAHDLNVEVDFDGIMHFTENPTADASPVLGTGTVVHALATSLLGDDEDIAYTWSASSMDVVFAAENGTSDARDLSLVFLRAGTYNLYCRASNVQGASALAWLTVTVEQRPTVISVTPTAAIVAPGASAPFSATVLDQFGERAVVPVSWSVDGGGVMASNGGFEAGTVAGGPFTVTAAVAGLQATSQVEVREGVVVVTAAANPVLNSAVRLTASVSGAPADAVYHWSTTGIAPGPVTFSANDAAGATSTVATFAVAGDYVFRVLVTSASAADRSGSLAVRVGQSPDHITISPWTADTNVLGHLQLNAWLVDQFGDLILSPTVFTWTTDTALGGVDPRSGLFTAGATVGGPFQVTAQWGSLTKSVDGRLLPARPVITRHITVEPDPTRADALRLSARAVGGNNAPLIFTWSVIKENPTYQPFISFTANGTAAAQDVLAVFDRSGGARVQLQVRDAYGQTAIETMPLTLADIPSRVTLTASTTRTRPGSSVALSAEVRSQFGNPLNVPVLWSCDPQLGTVVDDTYRRAHLVVSDAPSASGRVVARVAEGAQAEVVIDSQVYLQPLATGPATAVRTPGTDRVHLSFAAVDPSGGDLTYVWTLDQAPSVVRFSDNWSPSAGETDITVFASGTYVFRVDAVNAQRQMASDQVTVVIGQELAALGVYAVVQEAGIPGHQPSDCLPGDVFLFRIQQYDQYHQVMDPPLPAVWSIADASADGAITIDPDDQACRIVAAQPGSCRLVATVGALRAEWGITVHAPSILEVPTGLVVNSTGPVYNYSTGSWLEVPWGSAYLGWDNRYYYNDPDVAAYDIFCDGVQIATWPDYTDFAYINGYYFLDRGAGNGWHEYAIRARSALGEVSDLSEPVTAFTGSWWIPNPVYEVTSQWTADDMGAVIDWSSFVDDRSDPSFDPIRIFSIYRQISPGAASTDVDDFMWCGDAYGSQFYDPEVAHGAAYAYLIIPMTVDGRSAPLAGALLERRWRASPSAQVYIPYPGEDPIAGGSGGPVASALPMPPQAANSPVAPPTLAMPLLAAPANLRVIDEDDASITIGWDAAEADGVTGDLHVFLGYRDGFYSFSSKSVYVTRLDRTATSVRIRKSQFEQCLHDDDFNEVVVLAARPRVADPGLWSVIDGLQIGVQQWSEAQQSWASRFSAIPSAATLPVHLMPANLPIPAPTVTVDGGSEVPVVHFATAPQGPFRPLGGCEAELDGALIDLTWLSEGRWSQYPPGVGFDGVGWTWTIDGLSLTTNHVVRLRTVNVNGRRSPWTAWLPLNVRDSVPPSVPQGFAATMDAQGVVRLSWEASSDANGVAGYEVFRDGDVLVRTTDLSAGDTLTTELSTRYAVRAYDLQGNRSDWSPNQYVRRIPAVDAPPATPERPWLVARDAAGIRIAWSQPATAVDHFVIWGGDGQGLAALATVTGTTWTEVTSIKDRIRQYAIQAVDARGRTSAPSPRLTVLDGTAPAIVTPAGVVLVAGGMPQGGEVVTGERSVVVRVEAADDGGAEGLTYSWTCLDPERQRMVILPNGTAQAAEARLTFPAPGTYPMRVTVTDQLGLLATSDLVITVVRQLDALRIAPGEALVASGGTQQFSCAAEDQFGVSMPTGEVAWTVDGGSIDAAGLFTAPVSGSGPWQVQAQAGVCSATARVQVLTGGPGANQPPHLVQHPTATADDDGLCLLLIDAEDDGGAGSLSYAWTVVSQPAGSVVSLDGGETPVASTTLPVFGTYRFRIRVTDQAGASAVDEVSLDWLPAAGGWLPVFTRMPSVTLSEDGRSFQLAAAAVLQSAPQAGLDYQWTVEPLDGTDATTSEWGAASRTIPVAAIGTYRITARVRKAGPAPAASFRAGSPARAAMAGGDGGDVASALATADVPAVLTRLQVTPATGLVRQGGTLVFVVSAINQFNLGMPVPGQPTWTMSNSAIGTLAQGAFLAGSTRGTSTITVAVGTRTATAQVTVVPAIELYLDGEALAGVRVERTSAGVCYYSRAPALHVSARLAGASEGFAVLDQGLPIATVAAGADTADLTLAPGDHVLTARPTAAVETDADDLGIPLYVIVESGEVATVTWLPGLPDADAEQELLKHSLSLNINQEGGPHGNAAMRSWGMAVVGLSEARIFARVSVPAGSAIKRAKAAFIPRMEGYPTRITTATLVAGASGLPVRTCDISLPGNLDCNRYGVELSGEDISGQVVDIGGLEFSIGRTQPTFANLGAHQEVSGWPIHKISQLMLDTPSGQAVPLLVWQGSGDNPVLGDATSGFGGHWRLHHPVSLGGDTTIVGMDTYGNISAEAHLRPVYGFPNLRFDGIKRTSYVIDKMGSSYTEVGATWLNERDEMFMSYLFDIPLNERPHGRILQQGSYSNAYLVEISNFETVSLESKYKWENSVTLPPDTTSLGMLPCVSDDQTFTAVDGANTHPLVIGTYVKGQDHFGGEVKQKVNMYYFARGHWALYAYAAIFFPDASTELGWTDPVVLEPPEVVMGPGVKRKTVAEATSNQYSDWKSVYPVDPTNAVSPQILCLPPTWGATRTQELRVAEEGFTQALQIEQAIGRPFQVTGTLTDRLGQFTTVGASADSYAQSGVFSVQLARGNGPGMLGSVGILDFSYGVGSWRNPGGRYMRSVRIDGDVVQRGTDATISIVTDFLDKDNSLASLVPAGAVHFVTESEDLTLTSDEAAAIVEVEGAAFLPDDRISILAERLVADARRPDALQVLQLDVHVGRAVPLGLAHVDILLGAIRGGLPYSASVGDRGSLRMADSLDVVNLDLLVDRNHDGVINEADHAEVKPYLDRNRDGKLSNQDMPRFDGPAAVFLVGSNLDHHPSFGQRIPLQVRIDGMGAIEQYAMTTLSFFDPHRPDKPLNVPGVKLLRVFDAATGGNELTLNEISGSTPLIFNGVAQRDLWLEFTADTEVLVQVANGYATSELKLARLSNGVGVDGAGLAPQVGLFPGGTLDLASGNVSWSGVHSVFPTPEPGPGFSVTYNQFDGLVTGLGRRWRTSFDMRLLDEAIDQDHDGELTAADRRDGDLLVLIDGTGRRLPFTWNGRRYAAAPTAGIGGATIEVDQTLGEAPGLELTPPERLHGMRLNLLDNHFYDFDRFGYLRRIESLGHQAIGIKRATDLRLALSARDRVGRVAKLTPAAFGAGGNPLDSMGGGLLAGMKFTYDAQGRMKTATLGGSIGSSAPSWELAYTGEQQRPVSVTQTGDLPAPLTTEFAFTPDDPTKEVTQAEVSGPFGGKTIFDIDAKGDCWKTCTQPGVVQVVTTRDVDPAFRRLSTETTGRMEVGYSYDGLGNVIKRTVSDGPTDEYLWSADGITGANLLVKQSRTDAGATIMTHYASGEMAGQVRRVTLPGGGVEEYTYTAKGWPETRSSARDSSWKWTSSDHDLYGNPWTISHPEAGRVTYRTYAAGGRLGRLESETDFMGRRTSWTYDSRGRVEQTTLPSGGTTKTVRDLLGNVLLSKEANADAAVTTYVYDGIGRMKSVTAPGMAPVTTTYTVEGTAAERRIHVVSRSTHQPDDGEAVDRVLSDVFTDLAGRTVSSTVLRTLVYEEAQVACETKYTYTAEGWPETVVDAKGQVAKTVYDNAGRVHEVHDRFDRVVSTITYDPSGRQDSVTDGDGNVSKSVYSATERTLTETNPAGAVTVTRFDQAGNPVTITPPVGRARVMGYDKDDLQTSESDAVGQVHRITVSGRTVTRTSPTIGGGLSELKTTVHIGALGYPDRVERTGMAATSVSTELDGFVAGVQEPGRGVQSRSRNERGEVVGTRDAGGGSSSITQDDQGDVKTSTDARGNTTKPARIAATGEVASTSDSLTASAADSQPSDGGARRRDRNGNVLKWTDARGRLWDATYDAEDRTDITTAPDGSQTQTIYTPGGRVKTTRVKGPTGAWRDTEREYDKLGNVVRCSAPDVPLMTAKFHPDGRQDWAKSGSELTTWHYDANGLLHDVVSSGGTVTYERDAFGRVTGETGPGTRHVKYTLDGLGRATSTELVGVGNETATFDEDTGDLWTYTDTDGVKTWITDRDEAGRPKEMVLQRGDQQVAVVSLGYNSAGDLMSWTGGGSGWSRQLDARGREYSRTPTNDSAGVAISRTFRNDGSVKQQTTGGVVQNFHYSDGTDGRLEAIQEGEDGPQAALQYNADGRVDRVLLPNGVRRELTYDAAGRLKTLTEYQGSSQTAWSNEYERTNFRLREVKDPLGTQTFNYDGAGRLSFDYRSSRGAGDNSWLMQFGYDGNGNRRTETGWMSPSVTRVADQPGVFLAVAGSWAVDEQGDLVGLAAVAAAARAGAPVLARAASPTDPAIFGWLDIADPVMLTATAQPEPGAWSGMVVSHDAAGMVVAGVQATGTGVVPTLWRESADGSGMPDVLVEGPEQPVGDDGKVALQVGMRGADLVLVVDATEAIASPDATLSAAGVLARGNAAARFQQVAAVRASVSRVDRWATYDDANRIVTRNSNIDGTQERWDYGTPGGEPTVRTLTRSNGSKLITVTETDLLDRVARIARMERSSDGVDGPTSQWTWSYDGALRQPKSINGPDGATAFTYAGNRVLSTTHGGESTSYVYGLGSLPLWERSAAGLSVIGQDSRGQIAGRYTAQSQNDRWRYTGYGVARPLDEAGVPRADASSGLRFHGQWHIPGLGGYQMGARFYDADVGGFATSDPARAGTNWTAYCGGDPVNRWDPTGLWAIDSSTGMAIAENGDSIYSLWSQLGGSGKTGMGFNSFQSAFLAANSSVPSNHWVGTGKSYHIPGWGLPNTGFVPNVGPEWTASVVKVNPEIAAAMVNNAKLQENIFKPELGRGGASWFVSEGNPYVGGNENATVEVDAMINRRGAIVIDSARLDSIYNSIRLDDAFTSEMNLRYRTLNNIPSDAVLSNAKAKSLARFMQRAAESRMWNSVADIVRQSESKVGEVVFQDSQFSKKSNGRFLLTTDANRIAVQPGAIISAMNRAAVPLGDGIEMSAQAAVERERMNGRLAEGERIRNIWRVGGRLMIAVGATADAVKIINANAKARTVTGVVGGWGGAYAAGSAASAIFLPADTAGPWAWAGHGAAVVVAGAGGYMVGAELTQTVYDVTIDNGN